jgi:predicted nucleic acid-binding protein
VSRGILDTSVIIAQDDEALAASLPDEAAISVATLAELHYGVLVAKDDVTRLRRLRRLGEIEAHFSPLPIDAAVARAYASVAHAVRTAGGQPRARVMDLWIAATALATKLPLFTRNRRDFDALKKLIDTRSV